MSEWDDAWTREEDFQRTIIEAAESWLGWSVAHFRPAKTRRGWRTPVQGSLGKGFPDLVLVKRGRLIVAETKSDRQGAKLSADQERVLQLFRDAGVETYVWRPSDWDEIVKTLQGERERVETTTIGEAMEGRKSFVFADPARARELHDVAPGMMPRARYPMEET